MVPGERGVLRIEISPRIIFSVVIAIAAAWLVIQLHAVVLIAVFALVLVGTLNPLLGWFQRRGMHRNLGLAITLLALLTVVSLALLLTLPALTGQVFEMLDNLPAHRESFSQWLEQRSVTQPLAHSVREIEADSVLEGAAEQMLVYSSQVLLVIGYAATTLVLAVYLLADGQRALGVVYAVVPRDYHVRLARIILRLEAIVGGYVRGQLITSAAITVFTFALLTACGVENALAFAVFAGLTDVIPFIGGVLATAPAVLGAIPQGLTVTLIVLGSMLAYQEFESRVIVPWVYGRALRLSAATVIVSLLVGGTLMGILGALLALPFAAALHMILEELRVEMPGERVVDPVRQARDEDAEVDYGRLSEGLPAQDASTIATSIALRERELAAEVADARGVEPDATAPQ